jgi:hypothetical protein
MQKETSPAEPAPQSTVDEPTRLRMLQNTRKLDGDAVGTEIDPLINALQATRKPPAAQPPSPLTPPAPPPT